jgi:hypothetical protein
VIFNNQKICYPWAGGIQANTDKLPVIVESFTRLLGGTITADQFVATLKK